MKKILVVTYAIFGLSLLFASSAVANFMTPTSVFENQSTDQKKKATEWVKSLELTDKAEEECVIQVVAEHLMAVKTWHDEHPASLVAAGINPKTGEKLTELDRQIIADSAMPESVHKNLMSGLRKDLTEEQVEAILDKYTIGKVDFTMRGYQAIVPDLTEEEAATILGYLKNAREMAVDYKQMKQISAIFEIYKTKSEQHLIGNGRDWRALYKAFVKKINDEKNKK